MCRTKSKKAMIVDGTSKNNDWVRILSFAIIVLCIIMLLALLGLMVWRTTNNNPDVYRVIVTADALPDSLKTSDLITYEQADSLIMAVRTYDEQLTQKYQYLVEQKEQDSQVFYWGSLIVGVIIAVFGWFGFQSFTTIEDKAKSKAAKVADKVAKRTAWSSAQKFLNDEGKKQIIEAAKDNLQENAIKKVKEQVINDLNNTIEARMAQYMPANKYEELDGKIENLETSIKPDIDKAVKAAVSEVFDKYKKQTKGTIKGKEETK